MKERERKTQSDKLIQCGGELVDHQDWRKRSYVTSYRTTAQEAAI